jgi:hypothetical protein
LLSLTVQYRFHESPSLHHNVKQMNKVHTTDRYIFKTRFNIILPSTFVSSNWRLSFSFPTKILWEFPHLPHSWTSFCPPVFY